MGTNRPDNISSNILDEMKKEFDYWYPIDIRISGKDLVPNHLTMCLYNHAAIWKNKNLWPRSYQINGHIMLNGKKMSKSTGNFMTLIEVINKYGADATRIALAKAGSSINDADFTEENASSSILKLTTEMEWCKQIIDEFDEKTEKCKYNFWDFVFDNEIDICVDKTTKYFERMEFRKAIISGFDEILINRNEYRLKYRSGIINRSDRLIKKYLTVSTILLYPFCPHQSETIWNYAKDKGIILDKKWPTIGHISYKQVCLKDSINNTIKKCRKKYKKLSKKTREHNIELQLEVYKMFSDIEVDIILLAKTYKSNIDWTKIVDQIVDKNNKTYMFIKYIQNKIEKYGKGWLEFILDNDEKELQILKDWIPKILKNYEIQVDKYNINQNNKPKESFSGLGPGNPKIIFKCVDS